MTYQNNNNKTYKVIDLVMPAEVEAKIHAFCQRTESSFQGFAIDCVRKFAFANGVIVPPINSRCRNAETRNRALKRPIFFPSDWAQPIELLQLKTGLNARAMLLTSVVFVLKARRL